MKQISKSKVAILTLSVILIVMIMNTCANSPDTPIEYGNGLYYLKQEGEFIDYHITDGVVTFRYRLCFFNNSDRDLEISSPSLKFSAKELRGWIENPGFFNTSFESEANYKLIKSGEKVEVVVVLKGKYLGGQVNENLSLPINILYAQKTADNQ